MTIPRPIVFWSAGEGLLVTWYHLDTLDQDVLAGEDHRTLHQRLVEVATRKKLTVGFLMYENLCYPVAKLIGQQQLNAQAEGS